VCKVEELCCAFRPEVESTRRVSELRQSTVVTVSGCVEDVAMQGSSKNQVEESEGESEREREREREVRGGETVRQRGLKGMQASGEGEGEGAVRRTRGVVNENEGWPAEAKGRRRRR